MSSADPSVNMEGAQARHFINGVGRRVYVFDHMGRSIDNPAMDPLQRELVSPQVYGFAVRQFAGGRTAWAKDFGNGTMLVLNPVTRSHLLDGADAVRIMFVSPSGELLQDNRVRLAETPRVPEFATVRVTVNVTVDLLGATPEAAKNAVLRQLGQALSTGVTATGDVEIVQHSFELSEVVAEPTAAQDYSNTNFSQLLGI